MTTPLFYYQLEILNVPYNMVFGIKSFENNLNNDQIVAIALESGIISEHQSSLGDSTKSIEKDEYESITAEDNLHYVLADWQGDLYVVHDIDLDEQLVSLSLFDYADTPQDDWTDLDEVTLILNPTSEQLSRVAGLVEE